MNEIDLRTAHRQGMEGVLIDVLRDGRWWLLDSLWLVVMPEAGRDDTWRLFNTALLALIGRGVIEAGGDFYRLTKKD